ncbi:MAG: heme ABC transporter ATP-binding protein [Acidimicrobiia bacterium]|nr:heme ABC transporter ATP-binding protein [Acidimicrobiia bacterium]NNF10254.1 heme ABC transporter ATP-binding protein [Acidimicrobiia bacterium]NNL70800.1 heme ABC transporter ATP-binding protein [Acidimicrobiia bacterium]
MTPALSVRAAGYQIGSAALLSDVTLAVPAGGLLGIIGPNGAGKTSLLSLLAGDRSPSTGIVELAGTAIGDFRPAELARRRAVLPQQTLVPFPFTARDIVRMGRHPHHADPANSRQRDDAVVAEAMAETDTLHLSNRVYPSLSAGEQTRVALARVFAQETPVILLDEPTATLDIHHQEQTMRLLRTRAAAGTAIVAVLHDLNLAAAYADQLVLLASGRVAAQGTPREVFDQQLLSSTYQQSMRVMDHPHRDCPLVVVE